MPSLPSCFTCATRPARHRTATLAGPRATPSCTCSATCYSERGTLPRSPTRCLGRRSRITSDAPPYMLAANRPSSDPSARRVQPHEPHLRSSVLTNTYLGHPMGTIRVLRKATAQVELPLRSPLQALDK